MDETQAERNRLNRALAAILENEGTPPQAAAQRAAEWSAEAERLGIDPTPDYVGKGLRWLAARRHSQDGR